MNNIIGKLKEIEKDTCVYYDMKEEETEKFLHDIVVYANANREEFITFCRNLKPKEDSCLGVVVYQALAFDPKNWGEFFAEETTRIIELAKKSDKPFAVTSCLEEMVCSEEVNLPFIDKIIRTLEKELTSPIDALRHRSVELLSYWIDEDNQSKYQSVLEKMKTLLQDKNWKVRWMTHNSLKGEYGFTDDEIKLSLMDKIKGEKGNPYSIDEGDDEKEEEKEEKKKEKEEERTSDIFSLLAFGLLCTYLFYTEQYQKILIAPEVFISLCLFFIAIAAFFAHKHYKKRGLQDTKLKLATIGAGYGLGMILTSIVLWCNNNISSDNESFITFPIVKQEPDIKDECMVAFSFEWEKNLKTLDICSSDTKTQKIKTLTLIKKEGFLGFSVLNNSIAAYELENGDKIVIDPRLGKSDFKHLREQEEIARKAAEEAKIKAEETKLLDSLGN